MKTRSLGISVVLAVLSVGCVTMLGGQAEAGTRLHAAPQLSVGPELPISDPVFQSAARNAQAIPRVATGDQVQLVVWQDERDWGSMDIFGTITPTTGPPAPSLNFRIAGGPTDQEVPEVSWNGQNFLVVWWDYGGG